MLSQLPDYLEWKAKRGRSRSLQRLLMKLGLAAAFIAAFWAAWNYLPQSMDLSHIDLSQIQKRWVYYPNCDAARAAGAAPIHIGQPGYRPALDADNDGIACEPIPLWAR